MICSCQLDCRPDVGGGGSCPLLPWGLEHFFLTLSHCCVGGQTSALMSDQALQIMNDMSQSDQSRPGGDVCLACCEVSVGALSGFL